MDLDTVAIYWDITELPETHNSYMGEYLITDPQTNTVIEFGVTQIGNSNKKHYQQCIREALDQLFDSHTVSTILISSVEYDIKPELEIGRLKHSNREQARDAEIYVSEVHNKTKLLEALGTHYNDLEQGFTGFATQVYTSDTLSVHVDASYLFKQDRASVGICVLDSTDRIVYLQTTEVSAESPEHAEVRAIIEAVNRASSFNAPLVVHSDCNHIRLRLENPESVKDHMKVDIRRLSNLLDRTIAGNIRFISRDRNQFTDRLAKQGYEEDTVLSCRYIDTNGKVANFPSNPVIKSRSDLEHNSKHKYSIQ